MTNKRDIYGRKLKHYGGNGYAYSSEYGLFEVRYSNGEDRRKSKTKEFKSLSSAISFFDSLDCEKFIWDRTTIPELLDGYYYK